jgi:Ca-activated chloride channel family protein
MPAGLDFAMDSMNENPTASLFAVTIFIAAAAWSAAAQRLPASQVPAFRADSTLVLVSVAVVDRRGGIVNGLASDAFTLTDDGVRQPIRTFSEEDAPVSIGIVLDLSGSMRSVLGAAKEALWALMRDVNPVDEAFLNTVSTRPRAYSGFTRNFDDVLSRVAFESAGGDTALIDTIYESVKQLRSGIHTRKALLVISDGMDNHSRYSRGELLERAVESDAQIYTIAVATASPYAKPMAAMEEGRGRLFLDELAARTGGMSFVVHSGRDIAEAAATIGHALRNQYIIGFVPPGDDRGGRWHRVTVKVAGQGTRAYARAGYRPN